MVPGNHLAGVAAARHGSNQGTAVTECNGGWILHARQSRSAQADLERHTLPRLRRRRPLLRVL